MKTRKIILHYHLFKNAGTSLDASLKTNFPGDRWATREFPAQRDRNRKGLENWIRDNPSVDCFSSHTAFLPVPIIDGVDILPILFVRHPIDRIASAYEFERTQGGDGYGSVLARNTNLSGYIETRLALTNDRQCRDFHTHRLAMMYDKETGDEYCRAVMAANDLPFIGIVEQFNESIEELSIWLKDKGFKNLQLEPVRKNIKRNTKISIEEKLDGIKKFIGNKLFEKLLEDNERDLALYNHILLSKGRVISKIPKEKVA